MHGHGGPRLAHQMSHQTVETSIRVPEDAMRSQAPGIGQKKSIRQPRCLERWQAPAPLSDSHGTCLDPRRAYAKALLHHILP